LRILLTGAGGAAAISVWKSLADQHELYMGDIDPCSAGLYLVPPAQRLMLLEGDDPAFVQNIFDLCKENKIEVLIPTVDTELAPLAAVSAKFLEIGVKIPISPFEALKICRDKYQLLHYCQDIVSVPEFFLLTPEIVANINRFPLFAKPREGAGSRGARVIKNVEELVNLPQDSSYLVQELLPGDEYSVDVYLHSSGAPIAAVPRLRMKIDSGIAVTARTAHIPELINQAIKTAERVGIRYVANIQFKGAVDGKFKLLEINPRFPGTLPLTAGAGIDMPKLMIDDINGKTFSEGLMPFKELMVVRYWTEHFCSLVEWENLCQKKTFG